MSVFFNEEELSVALGMSVSWLRKDRAGSQIVPFVRLGGSVRYDLDSVRAALLRSQVGGLSL